MRRIAAFLAAAVLVAGSAVAAVPLPVRLDSGTILPEGSAAQSGLGVIVPVVGRLQGQGGILYATSLDVSNFSPAATQTSFLFRGSDVATGAPIVFTGTFSVAAGGGPLEPFNDLHFDDFIHAMVSAGNITAAEEGHGVIGSLLIVFDGVSVSGECTARARFFSQQFGGTIGVSLNGHEFDGTETTAVVGVFTDTTTSSDPPRLYSNVFLTNLGRFDSGHFVTSDDTVVLTAYSATTGAPLGPPKTISLATGRTASLNVTDLGVAPGSGRVIVVAKATSGQGLLLGVGSENDGDTKDPSGYEMQSASPSIGPPSTGDLAAALAGTWNGTWNNTTFSTLGSAKLVISTNSSAKTYTATLTLGGSVFGGTAPSPQAFSGSYSTSSGATFSGHSALFGDFTFTITPGGAISGGATNVPSANVSSMTFTGTATSTTITIHYTLTLKPSGTASGTVTLTKSS
jgi:hypothetical protein